MLYTAALFALFSLLDPAFVARGETDARAFAGLQLVDDGILAAIGLAFGRQRFPGSWRALGLAAVRGRWVGLGLAGGVGAAAAAWAVSVELARWGFTAPVHPVEAVLESARGAGDVLVVLLTVTVPVPFAEEVFFRGFAYRLLRARFDRRLVYGLEVPPIRTCPVHAEERDRHALLDCERDRIDDSLEHRLAIDA